MAAKFLDNLSQSLSNYFSPALSNVKNIFDTLIPSKKKASLGSVPVPNIPTPSPVPTQRPLPSADVFSEGFNKFAPNVPVANYSSDFATAAGKLPPTIDPLLPAIMALIETSGGVHSAAANNPFNIKGIQKGKTKFIDYPDISTALLGGQNEDIVSSGLVGQLLNNSSYGKFRETGNLEDFFNSYSPPGPEYGNPSIDKLLGDYNSLRALFNY